MTNKEVTFDTGANNTQIATSGSYGGSVIDLYSESAGGDMFVSTAQAMHGAASARFTSTGGTSVTLIRLTGYVGKKLGVRYYIRLDAIPTTETIIGQIRHASGVLAQIQVDTSGVVKFTTTAGVIFQTASSIVANTWYRIGLWIEVGTTSTNGKLKAGVYAGDSATPLGATTGNATTVDFGSLADVASFQIGKPSGTGAAINGYIDTARGDDAATDLLGPFATAPPVLTIVAARTVREIQGSATNSGVITLATDVGSPAPVSISGPDGSGWFRVVLPDPMTGDIHMTMTATNAGTPPTDTEAITIVQGSGAVIRKDYMVYDGSTWS